MVFSRNRTRSENVSCSVVYDSVSPGTVAHQAPLSIGFPRQDTGVICHFLPQSIFQTQGLNLGLLHCKRIL